MLKVIITGAYSAGKTSLVEAVREALVAAGRTVVCVPDVARDCPVPLNADQNAEATLWLISTQVAREIEATLGPHDVVLCDRGLPDVMAHDRDLAEAGGGWVAPMRPFLDRWLSTYDLILLARVDERIPIAPDGLRITDPSYRKRLDVHAAAVVNGRRGVSELPFGLAERVAYAVAEIGRSLEGGSAATT